MLQSRSSKAYLFRPFLLTVLLKRGTMIESEFDEVMLQSQSSEAYLVRPIYLPFTYRRAKIESEFDEVMLQT